MKNEKEEVVSAAESKQIEVGKIPYHAPALQHYGGLAELVQRNPSPGADGGIGDCSHS